MLCFVLINNGVMVKAAKAHKVKLNKVSLTLNVGKSYKLKVIGNKAKSWKSTKPRIASVKKNGTVKGLKSGSAIIKVKLKNGRALKCKVKVREANINAEALDMRPGETYKLSVSGVAVRNWRSSRPSHVSVTKDGMIKALKKGTTIIVAALKGGGTVRCTVTVKERFTGFSLNFHDKTLRTELSEEISEYAGLGKHCPLYNLGRGISDSKELRAVICQKSRKQDLEVIWENSNPDVVDIKKLENSLKIIIKSKSAGTATITCIIRCDGETFKELCNITVMKWNAVNEKDGIFLSNFLDGYAFAYQGLAYPQGMLPRKLEIELAKKSNSDIRKYFDEYLPFYRKEGNTADLGVLDAIAHFFNDQGYYYEVTDKSTGRLYWYDLFIDGKGQCAHWAGAFRYLCYLSGLDCVWVEFSSLAGPHAVNFVKVDGEWYYMEPQSWPSSGDNYDYDITTPFEMHANVYGNFVEIEGLSHGDTADTAYGIGSSIPYSENSILYEIQGSIMNNDKRLLYHDYRTGEYKYKLFPKSISEEQKIKDYAERHKKS